MSPSQPVALHLNSALLTSCFQIHFGSCLGPQRRHNLNDRFVLARPPISEFLALVSCLNMRMEFNTSNGLSHHGDGFANLNEREIGFGRPLRVFADRTSVFASRDAFSAKALDLNWRPEAKIDPAPSWGRLYLSFELALSLYGSAKGRLR